MLVVCCLAGGCRTPDTDGVLHYGSAFDSFFTPTGVIELQESPGDSIADIGTFLETRDGDIVIADAIEPRIRRYGSNGALLASFGIYGDGPFELRRVSGITETAGQQIVVADAGRARVTILTKDLVPDTAFEVWPRPVGRLTLLADHILLATAPADRQRGITLFNQYWRPVWSIPSPSPGSTREYPYWGSYASQLFAAGRGTVVTAYSFLYPIYVHDARGSLVDSLMVPPRGFRPAPILPPGAFSGPDADERRERWFASFDVIADLSVLSDTFLVVTHGGLRWTQARRVEQEHRRLDVYHLPSRTRIAENVRLPEGSRVLGGGRYLYVLADQPPGPWRIVAASIRETPTMR
jgi:hypothetical protein